METVTLTVDQVAQKLGLGTEKEGHNLAYGLCRFLVGSGQITSRVAEATPGKKGKPPTLYVFPMTLKNVEFLAKLF